MRVIGNFTILAVALLLAGSGGALRATKDPFVGTWRANTYEVRIFKTYSVYEVDVLQHGHGLDKSLYRRDGNELIMEMKFLDPATFKPTGRVETHLVQRDSKGHLRYASPEVTVEKLSRVSDKPPGTMP